MIEVAGGIVLSVIFFWVLSLVITFLYEGL